MNNRTKGVIAGIAGLALLTGGTTFALWSDSASISASTITNGNLDVAAIAPAWFDVSQDRTDKVANATPVTKLAGHTIAPATWRMVPGDTAEGTFGFAVALQGDNLAAEIDLSQFAAAASAGATVSYKVYNAAGVEVTPVANKVRLRGADGAADLGGTVVTRTALTGSETTPDLSVVVTVTLPSGIANRDDVTSVAATIAAATVGLNQVRF